MKKKIFLIFNFCFLLNNFLSAQNPLVKMWDARLGGTVDDWLSCILQTTDGGYLLGGRSGSGISGDKTEACWGGASFPDYWIVKIDSLGNKQWDKDFGGTNQDHLRSIDQAADGGFILGGYSGSGISGDKTEATRGGWDYWIVKTDSLGNKQWDKDFGGTDDDNLFSIQQTADGGFIMGGSSVSGIGGDKTEANWNAGFPDYWIVKTDSAGNKLWDKDFGGTGYDNFYSLQQTADGGFILAGHSDSGISGDKTQPTKGSDDYWIVKIDSLGNKQWDKDFGGTVSDWLLSIQQTVDGGYILGGTSLSGTGGDKTQPSWGSWDYWIVKTDALGNKQWDKDFGGTVDEIFLGNITNTADGGYLIAGDSNSPVSGNKTETNLGGTQSWVLKTDSLGNKQWDKTIFTPGSDHYCFALQSSNDCYVFANQSKAGVGGYKSHPSWNNSEDYWIVKFRDTTLTTNISNTEKENEQLQLSPNPTENKLTISSRQYAINTIEIYNILGEKVLTQTTLNNLKPFQTRVDVSKLTLGIYFVKAVAGEKVLFGKVVKQ